MFTIEKELINEFTVCLYHTADFSKFIVILSNDIDSTVKFYYSPSLQFAHMVYTYHVDKLSGYCYSPEYLKEYRERLQEAREEPWNG